MNKTVVTCSDCIDRNSRCLGNNGKSSSYLEPQDALLAMDSELLLVPAYKYNNEALFFFIKNEHNMGAFYVHKGFLVGKRICKRGAQWIKREIIKKIVYMTSKGMGRTYFMT